MGSRQGYTSIEKFNALMNISPPMTKNTYETLANNIALFAKDVPEEKGAAMEIHSSKNISNS